MNVWFGSNKTSHWSSFKKVGWFYFFIFSDKHYNHSVTSSKQNFIENFDLEFSQFQKFDWNFLQLIGLIWEWLDIYILLSLSIQEHGMDLHLIKSSFKSLNNFLKFLKTLILQVLQNLMLLLIIYF